MQENLGAIGYISENFDRDVATGSRRHTSVFKGIIEQVTQSGNQTVVIISPDLTKSTFKGSDRDQMAAIIQDHDTPMLPQKCKN